MLVSTNKALISITRLSATVNQNKKLLNLFIFNFNKMPHNSIKTICQHFSQFKFLFRNMKRIFVVTEGQAETNFVNRVMAPYFANRCA